MTDWLLFMQQGSDGLKETKEHISVLKIYGKLHLV